MFSPNHPTFDIEDAFSFKSPNYTPASLDYSPALPGNTPSESSNNSYGLVPIASPPLSLFHDDPYIKVMHAYDAIIPPQVPIPPLTIVPPSPMLSPIFKNSFFWRKYCHQRNEVVNDHPLLLLPYLKHLRWEKVLIRQDFYFRTNHRGGPGSPPIRYEASFWIQSMSSRTAREDHHHQATRLDLMAPKRTSTSAAPAMTQAAIRQLVANSVAATLEAQAANMANTDNTNRNPEPRETPATRKLFSRNKCTEDCKVKFSTEVRKIEDEFYNLVVKGNDLKTYARRFQELATLCLNMVPNNEKLMEVFIEVFPQSIEGTVTASKPQTLEEAVNIAQRLMDQIIKCGFMQGTSDHKRNFNDKRNTTNDNNYHNNHNNDQHQQHNRRQEIFRAYAATLTENRGYVRPHPLCKRCTLHHTGLVPSDVKIVTKWSIILGSAKTKDFYSQTSLHHPTKSQDKISLRFKEYHNL
uniref:Reverse transcriptase domain-containing protein n=1 Tax=Tanacetum cinerariifolium TaxID=118510 RepID=A0A6L2J475_TANCI|nr:reverse transcriptase domain-containing protein [Tanacetum cinerariifolium]